MKCIKAFSPVATILLSLTVFLCASVASATSGPPPVALVGTSVAGSLNFAGSTTNFFNPTNGFVPAGYENSSPGTNTVTITTTGIEFGFQDSSNTDTVDFGSSTGGLVQVTDACLTTAGAATYTFTDPSFAGLSAVIGSVNFTGGTASVSGSTLTVTLPAFTTANTYTMMISLVYQVPTPVIVLPAGGYIASQGASLTMTDSLVDPNTFIIYSIASGTTGSGVNGGSPSYSTPINLASAPYGVGTWTVNAQAYNNTGTGYTSSNIAVATYTIYASAPYTVNLPSTPLTIKSGAQGTTTVTVTPVGGFNSTVSFACTGQPAGASCTFSPATVTPPGTTSTTLTYTAQTLTGALRRDSSPLLPGGMALALGACLFGWKRWRKLQFVLLLAVSFVGLGLLTSCGGGPTPVTSTVTVTATSAGDLSSIATFSVTVQ